jgi:alkylation response protein AidB-like acyl-CoA dehydrogenase
MQNVIGEPGDYYKLLLFGPYFQLGWIAVYVEIAGGALEAGMEYVKTKSRHGKKRAISAPCMSRTETV